jgi:alpha-1,2-mannosyltransferase
VAHLTMTGGRSTARIVVSLVALGTLTPPLVVAVAAMTGSVRAAAALGVVVFLAAAPVVASRLTPGIDAAAARRPGIAALWAIAGLLAVAASVSLAVYVHDPSRVSCSVLPRNAFFPTHACVSSYTEAARLLGTPGVNIYDPAVYMDRHLGPLEVDIYQYPPVFLLLPRAARVVTEDFFVLRAVWFAVQSALFAAAVLLTAAWIGGRTGLVAGLLAPLLWLAPPVRLVLQLGNFQITAFAIAMLAMLAFERRRLTTGGLLLGFGIASKFFPGAVGLWLAGTRRWREVAAIAAGAIGLSVLALGVLGREPFVQFATYQLPRILDGRAFFWMDNPAARVVNSSPYGLVSKLRSLGVDAATPGVGRAASSVYAIGVILLGLWAGHRQVRGGMREDSEARRAHAAQVWLGLLSLAALRSPFTPDAYATVGTLWLLALIVAAQPALSRRAIWAAAGAALAFSVVLDGYLPSEPPLIVVGWALLVQVTAYALNIWVVVRRPAPQPPGAPA